MNTWTNICADRGLRGLASTRTSMRVPFGRASSWHPGGLAPGGIGKFLPGSSPKGSCCAFVAYQIKDSVQGVSSLPDSQRLARIIEFLGSRRALPQTRVASAGRRFAQCHIVQAGQTVWLYSDVTCAFPSASGRVIIVSIGFVRGIAIVRKSSHDLVASPLHRLMPVKDASSRKRSST